MPPTPPRTVRPKLALPAGRAGPALGLLGFNSADAAPAVAFTAGKADLAIKAIHGPRQGRQFAGVGALPETRALPAALQLPPGFQLFPRAGSGAPAAAIARGPQLKAASAVTAAGLRRNSIGLLETIISTPETFANPAGRLLSGKLTPFADGVTTSLRLAANLGQLIREPAGADSAATAARALFFANPFGPALAGVREVAAEVDKLIGRWMFFERIVKESPVARILREGGVGPPIGLENMKLFRNTLTKEDAADFIRNPTGFLRKKMETKILSPRGLPPTPGLALQQRIAPPSKTTAAMETPWWGGGKEAVPYLRAAAAVVTGGFSELGLGIYSLVSDNPPENKPAEPKDGGLIWAPVQNNYFQIERLVVEGANDPEKFLETVKELTMPLLSSPDQFPEGN